MCCSGHWQHQAPAVARRHRSNPRIWTVENEIFEFNWITWNNIQLHLILRRHAHRCERVIYTMPIAWCSETSANATRGMIYADKFIFYHAFAFQKNNLIFTIACESLKFGINCPEKSKLNWIFIGYVQCWWLRKMFGRWQVFMKLRCLFETDQNQLGRVSWKINLKCYHVWHYFCKIVRIIAKCIQNIYTFVLLIFLHDYIILLHI